MSMMKDVMYDRLVHLERVEHAVRMYLAHLHAVEQGDQDDGFSVEDWRLELERLTL